MHLTNLVLRFSNHIRFERIPGNVLIGKHRIWPKLTTKHKRYLLNQIDGELDNMKHISQSYITREEEKIADSSFIQEARKVSLAQKIEKQRMNLRKMESKTITNHLEPLRDHKGWE